MESPELIGFSPLVSNATGRRENTFRNGQNQVPIPLFCGYDAARKQFTEMCGGSLSPQDDRGVAPRSLPTGRLLSAPSRAKKRPATITTSVLTI